MNELKACPFCGLGVGKICSYSDGYVVKCLHCCAVLGDVQKEDATGCFEPFDSEREAIEAWNNQS